jgi:hypothetical protein
MHASSASRRRTGAVVAALAASIALAVVPAWSASAHSAVTDSTPGEGETLTALPDTFSITANEDLLDITGEASGFALQIVDADGLHYEQSCPVVDGTELSTGAAIGGAGEYELRYQFVSADGHAVSGAIPFEWAPVGEVEATAGTEASLCGGGAAPEAAEGSAEPINPITDTSTPLFWGIGILAALAIIAAIVAVIVKVRRTQDRG